MVDGLAERQPRGSVRRQFCVAINPFMLARRNGSREKVEALEHWRDSELFDEKEKAVREYTEAVTYSDRQASEELMQGLCCFFDDAVIVELTGLLQVQRA